jgi:hypothetical protein
MPLRKSYWLSLIAIALAGQCSSHLSAFLATIRIDRASSGPYAPLLQRRPWVRRGHRLPSTSQFRSCRAPKETRGSTLLIGSVTSSHSFGQSTYGFVLTWALHGSRIVVAAPNLDANVRAQSSAVRAPPELKMGDKRRRGESNHESSGGGHQVISIGLGTPLLA